MGDLISTANGQFGSNALLNLGWIIVRSGMVRWRLLEATDAILSCGKKNGGWGHLLVDHAEYARIISVLLSVSEAMQLPTSVKGQIRAFDGNYSDTVRRAEELARSTWRSLTTPISERYGLYRGPLLRDSVITYDIETVSPEELATLADDLDEAVKQALEVVDQVRIAVSRLRPTSS